MPSYNRVILIGRLTRDPELRYTAGGLAMTKFGIAVDRRFKNQQGERVTDFFDCTAWRQKAEFVANYIGKGRLVAVEGSIEINEATGQDGQKRRYTNIICDNIETLESQREGGDQGGGGGYNRGANAGASGADSDFAPGEESGGYFPDDEGQGRTAPARAGAAVRPGGGSGAPGASGPAGAARSAAAATGAAARPGAGGTPRPAEAAFSDDDFDDSDPFADQ